MEDDLHVLWRVRESGHKCGAVGNGNLKANSDGSHIVRGQVVAKLAHHAGTAWIHSSGH
jgi:hypothetical protein